jgi:hypothetical protein
MSREWENRVREKRGENETKRERKDEKQEKK